MAPNAGPPTAPAVRQQQMPPMSSFLPQGQGAPPGGPAPDIDQPMGMDYALSKLNEVAAMLGEVAKVLAAESPQLIPILKKMVESGAMLSTEVKTAAGAVMGGAGDQPPLEQDPAAAGTEGGAPPPEQQ